MDVNYMQYRIYLEQCYQEDREPQKYNEWLQEKEEIRREL